MKRKKEPAKRIYLDDYILQKDMSINSGKTIISYDHKQLMGIIEQIDTLLIEALNIDKSFLTYLNQWYFDFVDCGRQSVDEFQE